MISWAAQRRYRGQAQAAKLHGYAYRLQPSCLIAMRPCLADGSMIARALSFLKRWGAPHRRPECREGRQSLVPFGNEMVALAPTLPRRCLEGRSLEDVPRVLAWWSNLTTMAHRRSREATKLKRCALCINELGYSGPFTIAVAGGSNRGCRHSRMIRHSTVV
jgi:hypothetical protein